MLNDIINHPAVWRASALQTAAETRQQVQHNVPANNKKTSLQAPAQVHSGLLDTGFAVLNEKLADRGWPTAGVIEILHDLPGHGELSLLLPALKQLAQQPKWTLWIAPPFRLHAPALVQAGVDISKQLLVHPKTEKDRLWCIEEAARSGAASAILAWPGKARPEHIRRLQIIASQQQIPCFLIKGSDSCATPCTLRLHVRAIDHEQLCIHILKRRRGWPAEPFIISLRKCSHYRYQKSQQPPRPDHTTLLAGQQPHTARAVSG